MLRRRLGPVVALAPTLLILFLGSTPVLLAPYTWVFAQSTAAGLAALIALERRDRVGDAAACALLLLSVASFTLGIPFLVGVAILIALDPERFRRAWVVLVPVALYGAWFVWALKFDQASGSLWNVLSIPAFAADSLAAALGAMAGLGRDVGDRLIDLSWGRILVPVVVALLVVRGLRVALTATALALIGILATFWIAGALDGQRLPEIDRFVYPAAVVGVLLAAEMFKDVRITGAGVVAVFAVLLLALPGNLLRLRETGAQLRLYSDVSRAQLAIVELQRDRVAPEFVVDLEADIPTVAGEYLEIVDRFGSTAHPIEEVASRTAYVRAQADLTLARILEPVLEPAGGERTRNCTVVPAAGGAAELRLPTGGG